MNFPWSKKPETRQQSSYTDTLISYLVNRASGSIADSASTAAVEAAAGALQRAFMSTEIQGPDWIQRAVNPSVLGQIGRDLVRNGSSLNVITLSGDQVRLLPASYFTPLGDSDDPASWRWECTTGGPSGTVTRNMPDEGVIFVAWGHEPGRAYRGVGPLAWASTTAKLGAETERSMGDEAAGPMGNFIPFPSDGGDGSEDDPHKDLKMDISRARGNALLVETVNAGHDMGKGGAPQKDWVPNRLGPDFPVAMATVQKQAFASVLAACGVPPGMFEAGADGTSQREALRRWHLNVVMPLARILEHELTMKLETEVRLRFDPYPIDLVSRATTIDKLVRAGIAQEDARKIAGLME